MPVLAILINLVNSAHAAPSGYSGRAVQDVDITNSQLLVGTTEPIQAQTRDDLFASKVSTENSSTANLGAGATFTGQFADILGFSIVSVILDSDQSSAEDGIKIEWSTNGTTVTDSDTFSFSVDGTRIFTFGAYARFVRVRYVNGATPQGSFALQTILHKRGFKPSSHRIKDSLSQENDATVVKAVLSGKSDGRFENVLVSNGRLQVADVAVLPAGSVDFSTTAISDVTGTADTVVTIPTNSTATLQAFFGGCEGDNSGSKVQIFEDVDGTGSDLNTIAVGYCNGSNFDFSLSRTFVGTGGRAIRLRRQRLGGGAAEVFGRFRGFSQ